VHRKADATGDSDRTGGGAGDGQHHALPAELDQRIAALESGGQCGEDFDGASLRRLFVLGVLLPAGLLIIGWWA
jgi:hypothetical protein